MRAARVGILFVIGAALALVAPGVAAAARTPNGPSFKVAISPEYTTGGQPTTFEVTVVNTSSARTTLGSVKITPPAGFTPPQPVSRSPLRGKTTVQNRSLMLDQISLNPGKKAQLSVIATAPDKCGSRTVLHWTTQAFRAKNGSGAQLALDAALSSLAVRVLCPAAAACGDGGPPCSTSLVTSESTYGVISDAGSGTLNQTVNVGNNLRCGAYRFRDPNWYDSVVAPASTSPPTTSTTPILDTVTYKIRNARAKSIGFCLGVGYEFTTNSGAPARAATLPTGNPGFIGLLPRCSRSKAPCISRISQQRDKSAAVGFDTLMQIKIPETGDPWGRA
jgi:hypothetical protein